MQDPAQMNMSLRRLAEVRKLPSRSFDHILAKSLLMYEARAVDLFIRENHLSIVTDGSCHSCKDMLISIVYSHRINCFAHMTGQVIYPSKIVTVADEFQVDPDLERVLARREQDRLSSYKLMQGLSHQISLITNGQKSLDSFRVPDSLHHPLKRLKPGGWREVRGSTVSVCLSAGEDPHVSDLSSYNDLPVLTLLQDQGPVGTAMASFLKWDDRQVLMMHCHWDKFHRLINDMKLAADHAVSNGKLLQTQLATGYVFSVNYKPFASGSFFAEKKAAMEGFLATVSYETWHYFCYFNFVFKSITTIMIFSNRNEVLYSNYIILLIDNGLRIRISPKNTLRESHLTSTSPFPGLLTMPEFGMR